MVRTDDHSERREFQARRALVQYFNQSRITDGRGVLVQNDGRRRDASAMTNRCDLGLDFFQSSVARTEIRVTNINFQVSSKWNTIDGASLNGKDTRRSNCIAAVPLSRCLYYH